MQPPAKCCSVYIRSHLHSCASRQGLEPMCRSWSHLAQSQYVKPVSCCLSWGVCRDELLRSVGFRGSGSGFLPPSEVATAFRGVLLCGTRFSRALDQIAELWALRESLRSEGLPHFVCLLKHGVWPRGVWVGCVRLCP